ncbi:DinB family protein [Robertmurraya korlensis]|uniref:DinB family protein n=1 Tax=Robertmurraya korlensis TaxID=519977 RepID=UPI00082438AA|nr:DinB family protein [Robertmurraya korlensis]
MKHLIDEYKESYHKIVNEIEGVTDDQFLFKPHENSWSIREIIIHVTDAELVHIHRMKSVLSEENPILTAFDQDAWTSQLKTQALDHQLYLSLLNTMINSFTPILNELEEDDFFRVGTHNIEGEFTFKELLEHSLEHIQNHIEQIRRIKKGF